MLHEIHSRIAVDMNDDVENVEKVEFFGFFRLFSGMEQGVYGLQIFVTDHRRRGKV